MSERDDPRPSSREVAGEEFLFHLHRGSELLQDNRVHAAKAEIEQALSLQPSDPKGQDLLGIVYFRLGLYPRAIAIYERLIQLHPDAVEPRINLALCYLKTGQPSQAKGMLERALEQNPQHTRGWGYLGLALQRLGEFERAGQAFSAGGHDGMARRLLDTTGSGAGSYSFRSESPSPPAVEPVRPEVRRAAGDAVRELDRTGGGFRSDSEMPRIPSGTWSAIEPGRESLPHSAPAPLREVALAAWPGAAEGAIPTEGDPPQDVSPPPAAGAPRPPVTRRRGSHDDKADVTPPAGAPGGDRRTSPGLAAVTLQPAEALDGSGRSNRGSPSLPQQHDGDDVRPSRGEPLSLPQAGPSDVDRGHDPPDPAAPPARAQEGRRQSSVSAERSAAAGPPSSVPRLAMGRPEGTLAFARERLVVFPRDLSVAIHPSGVALVQAAVGFSARIDAIRAMTAAPGAAAPPIMRRTRGRTLDEPLGGASTPLLEIAGRCELVLGAPPGLRLRAITLDEDPLYLREDALIGFEPSVVFESGRLPAGDGEAIPMVQLRGTGSVVAALPEGAAAMEIMGGRSTSLRAAAVLGWLGRLLPRAMPPSEAPAAAHGFVAFAGEGMVLVDGR